MDAMVIGPRSRWPIALVLIGLWVGAGLWRHLMSPDSIIVGDPPMDALLAIGFGPVGYALPLALPLLEPLTPLHMLIGAAASSGVGAVALLALMTHAGPTRDIAAQTSAHAQSEGRLSSTQAASRLRLTGDGVPLARIENAVVGIPRDADSGHIGVIAPTRSGKGLHLTDALLRWKDAAIVIDPKSEQWERTSGWRQAHVGPVYCIPPDGIDLLTYYDRHETNDVTELHQHLIRPWKDRDTVFGEKSLALLHAALAVGEATERHPLTILTEWATQPAGRAIESAYAHPSARGALDLFLDGDAPAKPNRFTLSAWGTMTTRLLPLVGHIETLTTATIPTTWSTDGATIYLRYPMDQLAAASGMISAVIAGLIKGVMRQSRRTPCLVAIDEMPTVGLHNLETYLATVGGYGITVLFYAQALTQIEAAYGKEQAASILANCHHQLFYGTREPHTARYVSDMFGTTIVPQQTTSHGKHGMTTSVRATEQVAFTPAQVMAIPEDAVVVFSKVDDQQHRFVAERLNPFRSGHAPPFPPPPRMPARRRSTDPATARLPTQASASAPTEPVVPPKQVSGGRTPIPSVIPRDQPDDSGARPMWDGRAPRRH
jgi:type IV secretion system protein VirD4